MKVQKVFLIQKVLFWSNLHEHYEQLQKANSLSTHC